MSSEAKVPEQWRKQYELNKKYLALPMSDPRRNDMQAILRSDAVQMAEELASLTAEIAMSIDHADILRDRAIRAESANELLRKRVTQLEEALRTVREFVAVVESEEGLTEDSLIAEIDAALRHD